MQVDLGLTAHANARVHYDSRKKHMIKAVKTVAANEAAFKAAEKKAAQQLLKVGGLTGNHLLTIFGSRSASAII